MATGNAKTISVKFKHFQTLTLFYNLWIFYFCRPGLPEKLLCLDFYLNLFLLVDYLITLFTISNIILKCLFNILVRTKLFFTNLLCADFTSDWLQYVFVINHNFLWINDYKKVSSKSLRKDFNCLVNIICLMMTQSPMIKKSKMQL